MTTLEKGQKNKLNKQELLQKKKKSEFVNQTNLMVLVQLLMIEQEPLMRTNLQDQKTL